MHTGIFRLFLLTLLLAFGGQAVASSCAETHESPAASIPAEEKTHCDEATLENCSDSHPSSCTAECSCCAGPGTSSAVNTQYKILVYNRNLLVTAYREFNSSPDPEMALRPPIFRT
ncbi:hypothetical protein [Microbulbifer sp. JMSA003]|uniref:hypothetical protein n=1 Tax=Microbulbifer sp. JMSA003 TaxID=3243369 RepID=UPI00403961D1